VIIVVRSPFKRVETPVLEPDAEQPLLEPRPATPRRPLSRQQWWLIWTSVGSVLLMAFLLLLHSIGVLGGGSSAQPAALATRSPGSAAALPAVAPPAPSPTTPAADKAPPSPASTVTAEGDPPLGTCKKMQTEDPEAFKRLYDGPAAAPIDGYWYGRTYDPNAYYGRAPAWIEECQTAVPGSSTAGKAAGSVEPTPKSGWQLILDALTAPFKWLIKALGGQG
jgi:hypothetical protein